MSSSELMDGLDEEQKKAVTLEANGIAAAGAGSGKTRVLASRYTWLITEKNLRPEEILTLTFTNKAVSEMYSRIYGYLLKQDNDRAREALRNFYKARIGTLDSFSSGIARIAAARYGISPDFVSDDVSLRELALEAALKFVLDHREDPAVRQLLVEHKIRIIAEKIFAAVVLEHSPVSSPVDFDASLSAQKELLAAAWKEYTRRAEELTGNIRGEVLSLGKTKKTKLITGLGEVLLGEPFPSPPDIAPLLEDLRKSPEAAGGSGPAETEYPAETKYSAETRSRIKNYIDRYAALAAISLAGNHGEACAPLIEYLKTLKGESQKENGLFHDLGAIANYALNFGFCSGVCKLLEKFQAEFNIRKRETGFLSFGDIARLAVDALKAHPDIRKVYKDSLKMIMVDEFQDNNALQRDLVYLLAEKSGRNDTGIPRPEELENNRMFFVGDEKQSIYRFRGADVAVFRSLGKDLSGGKGGAVIELAHNYRSRPGLIAAFNHIFGRIFPVSGTEGAPDIPDYEAVYSPILPPDNATGENPGPENSGSEPSDALARFCFLNEEELPSGDTGGIKSQDIEAVFIAGKIRDMVRNGVKIPRRVDGKTEWVPCGWEDFCVLERSYTHQSTLEKYFREFGVPYGTDRPADLFNGAPVLDILAYLRLIVYPEDRVSYATLIRSPFTRLSDLTLAVCMLGAGDSGASGPGKITEPFAEENEPLIPGEELPLYRRARERYRSVRDASRSLSLTGLITRLWFDEGYRYETLWNGAGPGGEGLFDLFFSLASDAEKRGRNLADFIEYVDDVMKREVKPDDRDIPGEGEPGVKIMTIHKSKGLEFPVVFLFDCANAGNSAASRELVSYHEKYGLILKLPQAEELPLGGNYFRRLIEKEEREKDSAELKRLLYVAMTRAERALYLTFVLPKRTGDEKKEWDGDTGKFDRDFIRRRLGQLADRAEGKKETFLKLLQPVLADSPDSLCAIETIPVLSRAEIYRLARAAKEDEISGPSFARRSPAEKQREAALAAAPVYGNARVLPVGEAGLSGLEASGLRYAPETGFRAGGVSPDPPDANLEKAGLTPANYGSLVHAVLESRLGGQPVFVPPGIASRVNDEKAFQNLAASAEKMTDNFLASELGKRCIAAPGRELEFPVITSAGVDGKLLAVSGKIDLLFEEKDGWVVVDFKTDRTENPEDHYGQMAAYYRAAGDIFGKPVEVWLCYLRSGRAVNVTGEVKALSLEELASEASRSRNKPET